MYEYFTLDQAIWYYEKGIAIICNGDHCTAYGELEAK